ncbi:MAG: lasso peptide biosynthesis B2 protein [Bacteroidota bacterium]|nr:lasso peptide biosynthesis B2 protein [Bacteroidota bacterium]MDP4225861.1 lasso peptide biosynthesis B2 protein [Bacteroidota bacterium]
MRMGQVFCKFFSSSRLERGLFIQACGYSAITAFIIRFFPMKVYRKWLGEEHKETPVQSLAENTELPQLISRAIRRCNKYAPWKTACYVQAFTAKIILRHHHLPSTLYFGLRKDRNGQLQAHAWLRCGTIMVTGNHEIENYTVVQFFS